MCYTNIYSNIIVYQKIMGTSLKVDCATRRLNASSGPTEGVPTNNERGPRSGPSLYPIHSDTECLDTASGLKNKQDTCMVSAFNNILWQLSTTFSYGKYARYFEDIMRNGDNLQIFV